MKQHINSKCHKAWLAECSNNRKNSKIVEKDLTIKIRQYQQQVTRLINEIEQLKKKANEARRVAGRKRLSRNNRVGINPSMRSTANYRRRKLRAKRTTCGNGEKISNCKLKKTRMSRARFTP